MSKNIARERLQKKVKQQQESKYNEVMGSTDFVKIREGMANILGKLGQSKIASSDTSVKACFSKYLKILPLKVGEWAEKDLEIIDSFVCASDNITNDKDEIEQCFNSYESLPASSQNKQVKNAIKNIYKTLYSEQLFTMLQGNKENFQSFRKAIQQKSFILAKALYEILSNKTIPSADLQFTALNSSLIAKFNHQDLDQIIELFHINLKTLRTTAPLEDFIIRTVTAAAVLIPYINEIWHTQESKAKALLNYCIAQGLPFQANESYNHALIIAISCKDISLGFIKTLLEANVVDINTVITPKTDHTCKVVKTPFSVALGKVNFDLLALLLEHGADPYLAINIARSSTNDQYGEEIKIVVTSGLVSKLQSDEERQEYFVKLDEFIENFFLAKLAKAPDTLLQAVRDQITTTIPTKDSTSETTLVGDSSSSKEESKSSQELPLVTTVLEQYLNYKQGAQNNAELPESKILEHKFDALFLKWMQSNESSYLTSLTILLEEHPELNTYAVTYLLNRNISTDFVSEAFADKPQLLHQFYTLKKKLNDNIETGSENLKLQKNVHEVQGNFKNKIFVKIPEEILEKLDTFGEDYKTKLLNQITSIKFIKTDSHGMSGIKSYSGCIKLKIARVDKNLYTTQRYLDPDGNILIIFDRLGDHNDTPYKGKNLITIHRAFKEAIFATKSDLAENHNDIANSDVNFIDLPFDADVSEVAVLGDS